MNPPRSLLRHAWIVALLGVLAFAGIVERARIDRVRALTAIGAEEARVDAKSTTGWAGGKRWLLLSEASDQSFESIALTQQMLSRGDWRVRRVDYENAPAGREVYSASPYRWWLAALASIDHAISGRPLGQSVERVAPLANPLLQLMLLASIGWMAARWFGSATASLLLLGLGTLFPFASAFSPFAITDFALAQSLLLWSVLLLVAALGTGRTSRVPYFAAGALGGAALWLSVTTAAPALLAIAVGALLAALFTRGVARIPAPGAAPGPGWRAWGLGGALMCLLGYVVEYLPGHATWDLRINHPLFGFAWLGAAELLQRFSDKTRTGKWNFCRSDWLVLPFAFVATFALPVALAFVRDWQFVSGDLMSTRLSDLPGAAIAESFAAWIHDTPDKAPVIATVLPVLLLIPAGWQLVNRHTAASCRAALALALSVALVTLALAFHHLRWWNAFDAAALVVLVAVMSGGSRTARWFGAAIVIVAAACGLAQLLPGHALQPDRPNLTQTEVRALYERGLAHWLADHAGPDSATVLAPPAATASFCFYGSLHGLGTPGWENRDGLAMSFRLASSTRTEDTFALLNQAGVNYIVLPSWDPALDTMANLGVQQATASFISALRQTAGAVFHWLRPVPYNPPPVPGFEASSVMVFQMTDEANAAVAESRVVEYLVEMHHLNQAAAAAKWLQRYPADIGAQVALAQYAKAAGDEDEFARVFKSVTSYVQVGADRRLAWDRRISLAVVLAIGGKPDLARAQVERGLSLINEKRVRELTTGSLYHLLVLVKHFDLKIADPKVHELALSLLPAELRERL